MIETYPFETLRHEYDPEVLDSSQRTQRAQRLYAALCAAGLWRPQARLLDVGCGSGLLLAALGKEPRQRIGCDVDLPQPPKDLRLASPWNDGFQELLRVFREILRQNRPVVGQDRRRHSEADLLSNHPIRLLGGDNMEDRRGRSWIHE